MKKQRITYLDLLKVIAMVMVVLSHVLQRHIKGIVPTVWFNIFYSVHMSLFMFVSGFLIKKRNSFKQYFKYVGKAAFSYLLPSLLFTILTVLTMKRYSDHNLLYWLKEYVVRTDTFYWYMVVAFILDCVLALSYLIVSKIKTNTVLLVLLVVSLFFILISPFYFIYTSSYPGMLSANLMVYLIPMFIFGFIASYIEKALSKKYVYIPLFVLCLITYVTILTVRPNFVSFENTQDFLIHQLGSLCGVIVYYYICKWLCKFKIFKDISKYGKYSMPLYLVHVYLIRIITPYVSSINEVNFYSISFLIIYMLTFLFGSLFITMLLCKNKYVDLLLFGNLNRLKKDV